MGKLGKLIGFKFNEDGAPLSYPGNTVITDLVSENPAYSAMLHLRSELIKLELNRHLILLPEDSYHLTVIRGLNDKVRKEEFWPKALPLDAPMRAVDEYISSRVEAVQPLEPMEMRYSHLQINDEDIRVIVKPKHAEQESRLKAYRDKVADKIGLRLPGHDLYTYHVTLAYMLVLPEEQERRLFESYRREADEFLASQPDFVLPPPYMAYYKDMFCFSSVPLSRD